MSKFFLIIFCFFYCFNCFSDDLPGLYKTYLNPNLFDLRGFLDWKLIEKHLKASQQKNTKVNYYNVEKVKNLFVIQGFDTYQENEELYQSRKGVLKGIGSLIPSLRIGISPGSLPSSLNNFVSGLLGFLIPYNWFQWLEARQFYEARRYTFLNTLLDKQSLAEVLYYKIHLAKSDYEIASFFKLRVKELVDHFKLERSEYPKLNKIDPLLLSLLEVLTVDMNSKVFASRKEVLTILPSLAVEMGIKKSTGHVDIERIILPDVASLSFLDIDEMTEQAKKNSLELKSLNSLLKAAKYTKSSKTSSFLSGAGPGADYRSFGLSFGVDSVADVQIAKSDLQLIKIKIEKTTALLDQVVSSLVFLYNESIRDYQSIVGEKGDFSIVYEGLKTTLDSHNETGRIETDVHQIDFLFNTLRRMNMIKHNILIYKTLIDRYLVTDRLKKVMEVLPVTKELERLKSWAAERPEKEKKEREKRKKKERKNKRRGKYNKRRG